VERPEREKGVIRMSLLPVAADDWTEDLKLVIPEVTAL